MIRTEYLQQLAKTFDIDITTQQLCKFDQYAQLLVEWNQKVNLTSIVEPDEIVVKHFLDSLMMLKAIALPKGSTLIDVGTGAGFPSTPLAIVRADVHVTQLDSLNKRIQFLSEVATQLDLTISTTHMRAEDGGKSADFREQFDFATARAVSNLQVLCEYCMPYVKVGGYFVALKGYAVEGELEQAAKAIEILGGCVESIQKFELPNDNHRSIVLIKKISHTPLKYPRNQGKIAKSPL